jgi:DNA polymerase (family 10)
LDIDWRQINYAIDKGVLISINPDAHQIEGIDDTNYGVWVAQKAMVTKANNLSSFSLVEFENYIKEIRKIKGV